MRSTPCRSSPARAGLSRTGANATGVQGGNGSANVLNLGNLGFYRTLVLFDGHRVPPTLYNSAVDADIIPSELLSSVDVVTGGVSAVYGWMRSAAWSTMFSTAGSPDTRRIFRAAFRKKAMRAL
jgi:outer membrane receptor protein involved in Fe transport